ncbi:MAG: hypothetical protein WDN10_04720 [bacterium]
MANKGVMGILESIGAVEVVNDGDPPPPPSSFPPTAAPTPVLQPSVAVPAAGTADQGMVGKIRGAVTSRTHSPGFAIFLANFEKAKQAFPNDPRNAAAAALVFSSQTSQEIGAELSRSVAASLAEAGSQINVDIAQQRERLAGQLDGEESSLDGEIHRFEADLAAIQKKLDDAKGAKAQIASRRADGRAAIDSRLATALASLAVVRDEIATIKSILPS